MGRMFLSERFGDEIRDYRKISDRVGTDHCSADGSIGVEPHCDAIGIDHYVIVRQYIKSCFPGV